MTFIFLSKEEEEEEDIMIWVGLGQIRLLHLDPAVNNQTQEKTIQNQEKAESFQGYLFTGKTLSTQKLFGNNTMCGA